MSRRSFGSRVRVVMAQGSLSGNLLTWEGDRMTLINTGLGDPYVVRRESIQGLELSRGRKRPWLKGLLVGAAIGGALGAVMPVESPCPAGVAPGLASGCETKGYNFQSAVFAGAAIGAMVGAFRQVDRWEKVPLSRFRIGVASAPGGAQAAVTITP